MAQFRFHQQSGVQKKMIELLNSPQIHGMVLFAFARRDLPSQMKKTIDPLLVVADDMPRQDEFIKEFYDLCDTYLHFQKAKETYEKEVQL